MTATVLRKEKQSLAQHKRFLVGTIWLSIIKVYAELVGRSNSILQKFPSIFIPNLFSGGGINRVYSQKSDLDAKEFCKLSLFYYLTWWWMELKSTMTKENASLCTTPGKEQGMNCQTDSSNASGLVTPKLLPGPETDLLLLVYLAGSSACRKGLKLFLFLHLDSRGAN